MVTFEHLEKTETISAHGDEWKTGKILQKSFNILKNKVWFASCDYNWKKSVRKIHEHFSRAQADTNEPNQCKIWNSYICVSGKSSCCWALGYRTATLLFPLLYSFIFNNGVLTCLTNSAACCSVCVLCIWHLLLWFEARSCVVGMSAANTRLLADVDHI